MTLSGIRVDLGAIAMKGYTDIQNWSYAIRMFCVISKILVGQRSWSYTSAKIQPVYSTAQANWVQAILSNINIGKLLRSKIIIKTSLNILNKKNLIELVLFYTHDDRIYTNGGMNHNISL